MVRFTYTAQKSEGEVYKGVAEAASKVDLFRQIRREGGHVMSVHVDTSNSPWSWRYWNARFTTVPEHDKIVFAQTLAAMLKAGLGLSRALSVIERQTHNPKFAGVLAEIESEVRRGSALNQALERFPNVFSTLFVSMIRAGEEAGDVPGSLSTVGDQMQRMYELKKKVRGAMMYPSIVLIAIVGVTILMITQVVPTLASTFEELDADLPASTQAIIAFSDFLIGHSFLAIGLVVALVVGVVLTVRTSWGRYGKDWIFINIPVIGPLVKEVNAARTARTFASLIAAGVDVITSLEITGDVVQNTHFKVVIKDAVERVKKGEPLSRAFMLSEQLYPPLVGEMIAVGEETGDLKTMLGNLAGFYEDEVSRKTKDMSTIIEPFLMVFIGAAVGFFAVAMVSPIYSLSDAI